MPVDIGLDVGAAEEGRSLNKEHAPNRTIIRIDPNGFNNRDDFRK